MQLSIDIDPWTAYLLVQALWLYLRYKSEPVAHAQPEAGQRQCRIDGCRKVLHRTSKRRACARNPANAG
jgi:hypothetical protein